MSTAIIFVPGNNTPVKETRNSGWKEKLANAFPSLSVEVIERQYDMWSRKSVEELLNETRSVIEKYERVILWGFSFGGLAIRITCDRLDSDEKVIGLITMGTPHHQALLNKRQRRFVESLGMKAGINKPILVIGGILDSHASPIVLKPKNSFKSNIRLVFSVHKGLFFNKKIQNKEINFSKSFIKGLDL